MDKPTYEELEQRIKELEGLELRVKQSEAMTRIQKWHKENWKLKKQGVSSGYYS